MRTSVLLLAASSIFAAPAAAQPQGNAYGQEPKVCFITFESAAALASGANTGITKAQYLPLPIAQKFQQRNPTVTALYTYGTNDPISGVTNVAVPSGEGITANMTTEQVCEILADQADD